MRNDLTETENIIFIIQTSYDKCEKHINDQALGIGLSIVDNGRLN